MSVSIEFPAEMGCYYAPMTAGLLAYDDGRLSCPIGFHCPNTNSSNPNSSPRICPANVECSVNRLFGTLCKPQGPFEPQVCPQGYYCPAFSNQISCPPDHFCPIGSFEPQPCRGISYCPEGTHKALELNGLLLCIVVDLLLILLYILDFLKKSRKQLSIQTPCKKTYDALQNIWSDKESEKDIVQQYRKGLKGQHLRMEFQFNKLRLQFGGKLILSEVSGQLRPSAMTAILGPSGAGKTCFLNVLCGKISGATGELKINGKVTTTDKFKKMIGYVPQDDVMLRDLTIREILLYSARIRLPNSWTDIEKQQFVDVLLDALGLTEVQHVIIGDELVRGISGGQRKRVNIGIELCAIPTCLFLDEPTSGLDSTAALEVCDTLNDLAQLGITVVSVIHQPRYEIFKKFDDVMLIGPGGKTIYMGPVDACQAYFENLGYYFEPRANPADVLLDLANGKMVSSLDTFTPEDLAQIWQVRMQLQLQAASKYELVDKQFHDTVTDLMKERGASFLEQIWYAHLRGISQQFASYKTLLLEVLVNTFSGVVIGISLNRYDYMFTGLLIAPFKSLSAFPNEIVVSLMSFQTGICATLAAAPSAVAVFAEEMSVFRRESSAGHSRLAYFLGKDISTIYRIFICSLHFATAFHLISRPTISFAFALAISFGIFYGIYGMSYAFSMVVQRKNAALVVIIFGLFYSVTSGFGITLVQARNANIGWLYNLGLFRWISEILWTTVVVPFGHIFDIEASTAITGFTLNRVGFDYFAIFLIGVLWRVLAFAGMYWPF